MSIQTVEHEKWKPHDVPAKRKDFRPWKNEFNVDYKDWSHVPDELYKCVNCGKEWGKSFLVITGSYCMKVEDNDD